MTTDTSTTPTAPPTAEELSALHAATERNVDRLIPTVTSVGDVSVTGSPDERIATLATAQHGRVARWQLLQAGITDKMIDTRLNHLRLIRITRGVYAVGHLAQCELSDEVAALLPARGRAILSHFTAGRLWRLPLPCAQPVGLVDVLVPGSGGRERQGVREHRTTVAERTWRRYVGGLPVTTAENTLLDLAPLLTLRELERALDEALVLGMTTRRALGEAAARDLQRPGSEHIRLLTELRGPLTLTRSQAEERFLEIVRAAGLPAPETNVRLHGFTVDFFWRDAGVVVEIDGYQWHSSRSAFERDRRKDAVMKDAGLSLTRLTMEAMGRRPLEIVARLAAEVATRSRRGVDMGRRVDAA